MIFINTFSINFVIDRFPFLINLISKNSILQNGVMFITLFCLSESIVLLLSLLVLLRKPVVLKKELSNISKNFSIDEHDECHDIKSDLNNSRNLFNKQFDTSYNEIQNSRAVFSHYKERKFSSLITLLNVIVLFIILINLQAMLTFSTILMVFYFSLLGFTVFLLGNLLTIRWLINPKIEIKANVHNIFKSEKTIFDSKCSKQIQKYISHKHQTLEEFLEKDNFTTPSFFRINGPKWIDFQKGFLIKDSSLKKILKVIAWITIAIVLLLVAFIFSLRLPSVQHYITKKAIGFYQKKVDAKAAVDRIYVDFPTNIAICQLISQLFAACGVRQSFRLYGWRVRFGSIQAACQ